MRKIVVLVVLIMLGGIGRIVYAQDAAKAELAGMFTYLRFSPASQYSPSRNLWGGGGAVTYNLNKYLGVKGEFVGYGSSTDTFTIPAPIVNPQALIPAGVYQVSGNLFTYLFGPVVKYRAPKFEPFGEILFGGAHTNVYRNLYTAAGVVGNQPDNNGFAMAVGGGLDIPVHSHVAIRVAEVDYVLNRLGKTVFGTTTTNNLNSFRYQGGIVFYLGGR